MPAALVDSEFRDVSDLGVFQRRRFGIVWVLFGMGCWSLRATGW